MGANDSAFPGWADGDALDNAWNTCILGGVDLVGIIQVHSTKCGTDVNHKKVKGSDKPTSTDNGNKIPTFEIDQWVKSSQINDLATALQVLGPHQPGKPRGPVDITHPLPNLFGIQQVRITDIEVPRSPTAKAGLHVVWKIEQWFDKPTETKATNTVSDPIGTARHLSTVGGETTSDFARHEAIRQINADSRADNSAFEEKLKPSFTQNLLGKLFGKGQ